MQLKAKMIKTFAGIIIGWFCVCLVSSAHLIPKINSITNVLFGNNGGPCFVSTSGSGTYIRSLAAILNDLKSRAIGLKYEALSLQCIIAETNYFSNKTKQDLQQMNWIKDIETLNISKVLANIELSKLDEEFQSQYDLLYELGLYIKEVKSSKIAYTPSEQISVDRLNEFETHLYQIMCSLQSSIHSTGKDVTNSVNRNILNPIFIEAKSVLLPSLYSAYITMQDGTELMEYLSEFYDYIGKIYK